MRLIELQQEANTIPDYGLAYLWSKLWEFSRKELGITLHSRLPEERLLEIDDMTMDTCNQLGLLTIRETNDRTYRRFLMKGKRIYWSTQKGEWIQD